VALLLWGWHRSGKDFNRFVWEFFFPGEVNPTEVVVFFNRLKWFLLVGGAAPLVWLGCDFYWVYLNCPSYLFPELNLDGLPGVPPRLDRLNERILNLEVSLQVQEDLLRRSQNLSVRYNYLVGDLVRAEELILPHYPRGVLFDPTPNPTHLLRRVTPLVGLALAVGLVMMARKRKNQDSLQAGPLVVFFFFGGNFYPGQWKFFLFSFLILLASVCFFIKLTGFPTGRVHPLTRVVPSRLRDHPEVIKVLNNFQEMTQLALAIDLSIWGAVFLFFVRANLTTPFYIYGLPPVTKITVVCYRTRLFCLDKITHLKDIPPELYHSLREVSIEGQNLYFEFLRFNSRLSKLEVSWGKTLGFHPLFLVLAFLILSFLVVKNFSTPKLKKSVYLLILPTFTPTPILWVRFLFPVLTTLAVGYLLVRWRRTGLGFNQFCEEYFFRPGITPQEVILFFRRLGWLVLAGGFVPIIVAWVELYWMYFYCHSYLYPELGLSGLKEVLPYLGGYRARLQCLVDRPDLYDPIQVGHLVERFDSFNFRYHRLLTEVERITPAVNELYPEGFHPVQARWELILLRRGWTTLVVIMTVLLLVRANWVSPVKLSPDEPPK
jgi:hypothetical protein